MRRQTRLPSNAFTVTPRLAAALLLQAGHAIASDPAASVVFPEGFREAVQARYDERMAVRTGVALQIETVKEDSSTTETTCQAEAWAWANGDELSVRSPLPCEWRPDASWRPELGVWQFYTQERVIEQKFGPAAGTSSGGAKVESKPLDSEDVGPHSHPLLNQAKRLREAGVVRPAVVLNTAEGSGRRLRVEANLEKGTVEILSTTEFEPPTNQTAASYIRIRQHSPGAVPVLEELASFHAGMDVRGPYKTFSSTRYAEPKTVGNMQLFPTEWTTLEGEIPGALDSVREQIRAMQKPSDATVFDDVAMLESWKRETIRFTEIAGPDRVGEWLVPTRQPGDEFHETFGNEVQRYRIGPDGLPIPMKVGKR